MIITCSNCQSRFNIKEELIKPDGSKVKCSKCQNIFTVFPPPPEPEEDLLLADEVLDDETDDSGVDIQKDFVQQRPRPNVKPVFEEPDVVGGGSGAAPAKPVLRKVRSADAPVAGAAAAAAGVAAARPAAARPAAAAPPPMPEEPGEEFAEEPAPPAKTSRWRRSKEPRAAKTKAPKATATKAAKPAKVKKESSGGLKKILLLLIVLIILVVAAANVLPKVGVSVPFLDALRIDRILGGGTPAPPPPEVKLPPRQTAPPVDVQPQDPNGILNLFMDPDLVNSGLLGNATAGILTIVEGQVRNNYDEPRKAIKIIGRLYNSAYELVQEKTVYAGNTLTEEELVSLTPLEIENRLYASGREAVAMPKTNVPFMIVFSNVPEPISNYVYECEIISSENTAAPPAGQQGVQGSIQQP